MPSSKTDLGALGGLRQPPLDAEAKTTAARVRAELFGTRPERVRIGRFALLERIGAGAMGVVFAAYDDTLDRKVAVKVIGADAQWEPAARARMLREAKALAKLSHPNVVQVYEAGEHDDQVFIAMEFVAGKTLRTWAEERRAWRDVLAAYAQAARGLAAAHRAGLIHRDFKPDNAMIDDRGVVRVMDFGLAREGLRSTDDPSDATVSTEEDAGGSLTRTGAVVGTPAYMAPELLRGAPANEASDQFSLCVSLWEALYGSRPFPGDSVAALVSAIVEGNLRETPSEPAVPGWAHRVVLQGLDAEPSRRWLNLDALADALESDPRSAARQRLRRVVGTLAVLGAGGWALSQGGGPQPCQGARAHLDGVWDASRRAVARDAIVGLGPAYAEGVWRRIASALDAYADGWAQSHEDACEATSVRGEQSTHVLDLRMACLQRAKQQLHSVADVLSDPDAEVLARAERVVDTLPSLETCDDVDALLADVDPPAPDEVRAVDEARAHLATARAQRSAGHYDTAAAQVEAARSVVTEGQVAYAAVQAEIALEHAQVLDLLGDDTQAEDVLGRAIRLASEAGSHDLLRDALISKIWTVGYKLRRPAEALQLRDVAEGFARHDPRDGARLTNHVGLAYQAAGDHDRAVAMLQEALEMVEARGPDDPGLPSALNNLATEHIARGEYEQARTLHERALALSESRFGPDHPEVALSASNLGLAEAYLGNNERAETLLRRALSIYEASLGSEHAMVALTLSTLADVELNRGRPEAARVHQERVVEISRKAFDDDDPRLADQISALGDVYRMQGDHAKAEEAYTRALAIHEAAHGTNHESVAFDVVGLAGTALGRGELDAATRHYHRALEIREQVLGADHPLVGSLLYNLALVELERGTLEDASEHFTRSATIFETRLGPEHQKVASALTGQALVSVAQKQPARALEPAERAVAILSKGDVDPFELAAARFVLADALAGAGRDRERARALATRALETYEALGEDESIAEVEGFLAKL